MNAKKMEREPETNTMMELKKGGVAEYELRANRKKRKIAENANAIHPFYCFNPN